jgi:hypothetical protein
MTAKQFFDWQTSGGTDDVMRLVDALERADIAWCVIGGVAVNHWAQHPVENHPHLWERLPEELRGQIQKPE